MIEATRKNQKTLKDRISNMIDDGLGDAIVGDNIGGAIQQEKNTFVPEKTQNTTSIDPEIWSQLHITNDFVKSVADNKDLFQGFELSYLEKRCEGFVKNPPKDFYKEIMEEIGEAKKVKKQKIDRPDWVDEYQSGMYEDNQSVGMFANQKELERFMEIKTDDD